uniref:Uncharacterized protein n=1 Tax=Avena sativa TaxID=4498 RepID=A0ACD5Z1Z6_AVESA
MQRHGARRAMRELEISMRAKDPVTPWEDTLHYSTAIEANAEFLLTFVGSASLVWFATRKAPKYLGIRPLPRLLSLVYSFGCGQIYGEIMLYGHYHGSATQVLEGGEEDMKMELAKIILNNHSTDELLVEALKRHFIAENVLSDQHQEHQVFRWRRRNSYVDNGFVERMKEYEANNSGDDDEATGSSVNTGLFEEDSLACILGNSIEMGKPPEHTGGTILTRREVRAHGRSHRRHRRADKSDAL